METLATKYQQTYYEQLPNWLKYNYNEYHYMKQNIGFTLFGPKIHYEKYNENLHKNIDKIYKKIITYSQGNDRNTKTCIYVGIIYNVVFNYIENDTSNKKSKEISAIPVFKIKSQMNTIWYIDNNGRIYKSWDDYLTTNTLPQCNMVVPKDGVYQCNPKCKVTKQSSVVWIEVLKSPACDTKKAVLEIVDTTCNVISVGATVALGIASFLTPIGPLLTGTGIITCGISGIWTIARSSQKLIDLSMHEESISLLDESAFPSWLGITGATFTLGTNSGAMLLSKAIQNGSRISNVSKLAYNSLIIGNLTVNGIGVVYHGYSLISEYQEKNEVNIFDILMFSSHILFLTNTVLNVKLAGDYIQSSNGTILEKFKNIVRLQRFREEYYRIIGYNTETESESLIYGVQNINNKQDFLNIFKNFKISFENGKITINGIKLIDPIIVAECLLTVGAITYHFIDIGSTPLCSDTMTTLKTVLSRLLNKYYSKTYNNVNNKLNDVNLFKKILTELTHMDNSTNILRTIFKISLTVIQCSTNPEQLLHNAIFFVWEYCKANLKEYSMNACCNSRVNNLNDLMYKLVTFIFDVVDIISIELYSSFHLYMLNIKPLQYAQ